MTEPAGPGHAFDNSYLTPHFDIVARTGDRPATVRAGGDIDLNSAAQFQAALAGAAGTSGAVIADLTAVTYCDSAAIRVLFTIASDHRLTVVVAEDGPITTMLKVAGLDQLATVQTAQ